MSGLSEAELDALALATWPDDPNPSLLTLHRRTCEAVERIVAARVAAAEQRITERVLALRSEWEGTRCGVTSPGLRRAVDDLDREWFAQTVERKGRAALARPTDKATP